MSIGKDPVLTSRKGKIKPSQKAREIADQFELQVSQPIQRASRRKMAPKAARQARGFYIEED